MSQRSFIAAMTALQNEQEAHIITLRQHAAAAMERGDLAPDHPAVLEHLAVIDRKEHAQRELLSAIALLNEVTS